MKSKKKASPKQEKEKNRCLKGRKIEIRKMKNKKKASLKQENRKIRCLMGRKIEIR